MIIICCVSLKIFNKVSTFNQISVLWLLIYLKCNKRTNCCKYIKSHKIKNFNRNENARERKAIFDELRNKLSEINSLHRFLLSIKRKYYYAHKMLNKKK